MKPVILHSEAERELRKSIAHYEAQRKGLGREFRTEVEAAVQRMRRNPQAYPLHDNEGTRKLLIRRFPFTLFFLELQDRFWIAAVAHQMRFPDYWAGRRLE